MGWAFSNQCNMSQKENSVNYLIIQYSKNNNAGSEAVSSFIQYLRGRNVRINISLQTNESQSDLITMNFQGPNRQKMIYQGNQLDQQIFDSLYNQIIS